MTFVVMCDGGPASLKAVSWASVPGYMMRQHEGEQLILLHIWERCGLPSPLQFDSPESVPQPPEEAGTAKRLPPSIAIHKTLETIMGSKATRDTLNYKLETMALQETPLNTPRSIRASMEISHGADPPRPGSRQRLSTRGGMSGKRDAEHHQQAAPEQTTEELEAAARELAEEVERRRAGIIAQYAEDRLKHHNAGALLLGAGNTTENKYISVGHVSRAVLSKIRQTYPLWFIKGNGTTLRLNTTALRHVVVLLPRPGEEGALIRDCSVVQYALGRCREGSGDVVCAVVIAEGCTPPEEIELYTQTLERLLQGQEGSINAESLISPKQEQQAPKGNEEQPQNQEAQPMAESMVPSTTEGAADANPTTATEGPAVTQEQDAHQEDEWPKVSVCQLHATKQVTEPTATRVPIQVVKFLQQRKTDVIVIASTVVEELQLALLGMTKQHVLVVPTPEPATLVSRTEPTPDPSKETSIL
ncbi:hypothetical protein, conserved [Trypanosoma brucei brucei TREU927]|uniref:Uncharacterized protein n=1 Tax=Trypanosoma brucei brucei (strain 927/4 GUTat10.1) TaxID=185431 RepID=Q384Y8_TRYB2|nr:hypothetical protein, conserved [Trypanosoma brucei brucei TREU927]EAN79643.1 hypothetical protein, conserved [Trypanosoma brucei brucei TREU927]